MTPTVTTMPPQQLKSPKDVLKSEDKIAEGDSELVIDLLDNELADSALERLKEEVNWETMFHRGHKLTWRLLLN